MQFRVGAFHVYRLLFMNYKDYGFLEKHIFFFLNLGGPFCLAISIWHRTMCYFHTCNFQVARVSSIPLNLMSSGIYKQFLCLYSQLVSKQGLDCNRYRVVLSLGAYATDESNFGSIYIRAVKMLLMKFS